MNNPFHKYNDAIVSEVNQLKICLKICLNIFFWFASYDKWLNNCYHNGNFNLIFFDCFPVIELEDDSIMECTEYNLLVTSALEPAIVYRFVIGTKYSILSVTVVNKDATSVAPNQENLYCVPILLPM